MTSEIGTHPLISFAVDSETIRVRDELEGQEFRLRATGMDESTTQSALTDLFMFPVDNAITVTVSELRTGTHTGTAVWNDDGEHLGEFTTAPWEFPTGSYFINVQSAVNCYLRIDDASFTGVYRERDRQDSPLELTFDEPTQIAIGARSLHSRPQTTITVPDDPHSLLEALPYLGSSIKEYTCERSWPTIRGHPPAIERGDHLEIPAELSRPETGVTITVPATYADLYRVAPLVFYLGADVEVGDRPELRLENGYVEPLRTDSRSLEETVDELLGTCLLLDSLTRVDGYLSGPRYEYDELAPYLPFYPPNLYDTPLADQLLEYLDVSTDTLEPYRPRWPMTAVFQPRPEDVELLPSVLDTLSPIRVRDSLEHGDPGSDAEPEHSRESIVASESSLLTCYTDPEPPVGAGCTTPVAFENARTRRLADVDDARVAYVTDDHDRADRVVALVDETETAHKLGTEAITVVETPTRRGLEHTLEAEFDVLLCDLHTSEHGFECADGPLDPTELDDLGVKTVAVCGPSGLAVGRELVRQGTRAGVALADPVSPAHVVRLFEYLFRGHPLVESVRFATIDEQTTYRFVGVPVYPAVRREGGAVPARIDVETIEIDEHELFLHNQVTDLNRLGSVSRYIDDHTYDAYQLNGATVRQPQRVSTDKVVSLIEDNDHVVRVNGQAYAGTVEESPAEFVREAVRRAQTDVQ